MDIGNGAEHPNGAPVGVTGGDPAIGDPSHLTVPADNPEFGAVFGTVCERAIESFPKPFGVLGMHKPGEGFPCAAEAFQTVNIVTFLGPCHRIR